MKTSRCGHDSDRPWFHHFRESFNIRNWKNIGSIIFKFVIITLALGGQNIEWTWVGHFSSGKSIKNTTVSLFATVVAVILKNKMWTKNIDFRCDYNSDRPWFHNLRGCFYSRHKCSSCSNIGSTLLKFVIITIALPHFLFNITSTTVTTADRAVAYLNAITTWKMSKSCALNVLHSYIFFKKLFSAPLQMVPFDCFLFFCKCSVVKFGWKYLFLDIC